MSLQSTPAIYRLKELKWQIAQSPQLVQSLREAAGDKDSVGYIRARLRAERHVLAMAITASHLKAYILDADHLGAELLSLSELVLRAQRHIVLSELAVLGAVLSSPAAHVRPRAPFCAPLGSFDDLASMLKTELDRIIELWRAGRSLPEATRADYRTAIQAAQTAMQQLGNDSNVARFLREGRARTDWPAFRAVCVEISDALTLSIELTPDLPLLLVHTHAVSAVSAARTTCGDEPISRDERFGCASAMKTGSK